MDRSQLTTLKLFGFVVEELPGKRIPKMTYYKSENGQEIRLPNLPADSYHMSRYLKRGFRLEPMKVSEPPHTELQIESPVGFSCETCGKVLSTRLALAGHSRSHKKMEV